MTTNEQILKTIGMKGRLGAYLNTLVDDLNIDHKGQYIRDLFAGYELELSQKLDQVREEERKEMNQWVETFISLAEKVNEEALNKCDYEENDNEIYTITDVTITAMKYRKFINSLKEGKEKE
jgi:hypothetical protein